MKQRDRDLAISRSLGKGVVTTGIMGSIGFAVLAALSTNTAGAPASAVHVGGNHGARLGGTTGRQAGSEEQGGDDRPTRPARTHPHRHRHSGVLPAPALGSGTGGAPQATTSGS